MKKAVIVVFDDFTDIDAFLPWDLLNRVKLFNENFEVKIVGNKPFHRSVNQIKLEVHEDISSCNSADLVFFSSGPGSRKIIKDSQYLNQFKLNPSVQVICSMCSGALVLAALGLLNGLSATTYPTAVSELRAFGLDVRENESLVTHSNIGTAANCLAAVDLMHWAISKLYNESIADRTVQTVYLKENL